MPERTSKTNRKKRREEDINRLAYRLVEKSTAEHDMSMTKAEISRFMSEMGRKGGKIGGKRRLDTMTPEQRSRVALKAAKARWSKARQIGSQ